MYINTLNNYLSIRREGPFQSSLKVKFLGAIWLPLFNIFIVNYNVENIKTRNKF